MINDIIQLLGIANPQLSKNWSNSAGTTPSSNALSVAADGFTMASGSEEWVAPVSGFLTVNQQHTQITMPDGTTPAAAVVLMPSAQVYLTLVRLYASLISSPALTPSHIADRPVPRYFVYSNVVNIAWVDGSTNKNGAESGLYNAASVLHIKGNLTIHDDEGMPIDPIAVANAFDIFINTHWTLEYKSISDNAPVSVAAPPYTAPANRQLNIIYNAASAASRIFFTDIFNNPFDSSIFSFDNITAVAGATAGLYNITTLATAVTRRAGAGNLKQLALAPNGKFGGSVTYPAKVAAVKRDFIRIKVVDWNTHIVGVIPADEPSNQNAVLPLVRENENIQFCFDGNACLGTVNDIISDSPLETHIASVDIASDFVLPAMPNGTGNQLWPQFLQGTSPAVATSSLAIPQNLFTNTAAALAITAHYVTNAATKNTDVYFSISGTSLQNGWALRVYTRVFHIDGRETRGNGAGTIVKNNMAAFLLTDPLNIFRPYSAGITLPANAKLMVDIMVINTASPVFSNRLFGNITTVIKPVSVLTVAETATLLAATNLLNTVMGRGISPSGFLGIRTSATPLSSITNVQQFILAAGADGPPLQAPCLPTQTRLDGLAVSKKGANWTAILGGLRLVKESGENFLRQGNPASLGGKDTHTVGVKAIGGLLSYDIAMLAFKRTLKFGNRIKALIDNPNFVVPAAPATGNGDFVGAAMQTIAKGCETPRLKEFQQNLNNLPPDAATLSSQIQSLLNSNTKPAWLPDSIKDQFKSALTGVAAAANHTAALNELRREYSSSVFGRRDSFYAIKNAVQKAKQFIYIETAFFGETEHVASPTKDIIKLIDAQLTANPGLKLILCLAQEIPFNRGYDSIANYHIDLRKRALEKLFGTVDTTTHRPQRYNQVVAFHPMGFPGRAPKIASQVIIVDDVWACIGSSAISQRGLFFDGSSDLVFADKKLRYGKSQSITALRKNLMAQYLRFDGDLPNLPNANKVATQNGKDAFNMLQHLTDSGGGGMIKSIQLEVMPTITPEVLTALQNIADPNGDSFYQTQAVLTQWLNALSTVPE
jgi:hypothetical protein